MTKKSFINFVRCIEDESRISESKLNDFSLVNISTKSERSIIVLAQWTTCNLLTVLEDDKWEFIANSRESLGGGVAEIFSIDLNRWDAIDLIDTVAYRFCDGEFLSDAHPIKCIVCQRSDF